MFFWNSLAFSIIQGILASWSLVPLVQWCPCVKSSLKLLEKGGDYNQHGLLTKLLAVALLHFVLQGQSSLLLQVSLDFLLLHSNPLWWKGRLFLVLVLEGVAGLHRLGQLKLFQHQWLGHRLWCWMVCLGNERRSFCHFWDCTQVLHFRLFCWLWGLLHFF